MTRTKLGVKLENPYSLENMELALDTLKKVLKKFNTNTRTTETAASIVLETTDLYVRFLPRDSTQREAIEADTTMIYYDYPLDYEIAEQGDMYVDEAWAEGEQAWLYTVVKPDYVFSDTIQSELLSELFIPENHPDFVEPEITSSGRTNNTLSALLLSMETLSLSLTDNLSEEEEKQLATQNANGRTNWFWDRWFPPRWSPGGTIRLFDDQLEDYYPMFGVVVRARRWFTTNKGITNWQGKFRTSSFRRPANYSIRWARGYFSIKQSWWLIYNHTARWDGPKKKGAWNLNIGNGHRSQKYYATIFAAAHDYYYMHSYGLTKPSKINGFGRLRISARKTNDRSSYVVARRVWNGSDISLKAWGRSSDQVYGTTIHELAHAAHRQVDRGAYNDLVWKGYTLPCTTFSCDDPKSTTARSARRVIETWATTVEIVLTRARYRYYLRKSGYEYYSNFQKQETAKQPFYTSAGYDLIDYVNQRDEGIEYPQDRVYGYTIKQIERGLISTNSWAEWKDRIRNQNPNNPTNQYINELFNNW